MPDADRERLGQSFDSASDFYQRARPDYPPALIERILNVTELAPDGRVLEVGCATGKATLPFAQRGFRITCVEPGPALAAAARRNLVGFDAVKIEQVRFEDWVPGPGSFDLVIAAASWSWVDPDVRYRKAAEVLRPRGYLAIWGAGPVIPYDGDPFFTEIQEIYDEIGEGRPPNARVPRPGELSEQCTEIEASGLFDVVDVRQFDWQTAHDAERYIELLNTFSGHIAMQDWQPKRLYAEIRRRLGERPDGQLRCHWGAVLRIAQRS